MWFRNDPLFFFNQITVGWRITYGITGWVVFVVLAVCAWRRRGTAVAGAAPDQDRGWAGGLGAFAHFGTIVLGIVISLVVAPSVSSINLAAAAPMLWTMMAWLYDTGGPRSQTLGGRAFAALLVLAAALHLPILAGRGVVRTEDWRGTARYIAALPACAGEPIPVLLPQRFSPDTPFFRTLAEQYFYGRYFPEPSRLEVYSIDELTGRKPNPALAALLAARAGGAAPCPVLVWAVHDLEPDEAGVLRMDLQRRPELVRTQVQLKGFDLHDIEEVGYSLVPRAFVYLTVRPGATSAPGAR